MEYYYIKFREFFGLFGIQLAQGDDKKHSGEPEKRDIEKDRDSLKIEPGYEKRMLDSETMHRRQKSGSELKIEPSDPRELKSRKQMIRLMEKFELLKLQLEGKPQDQDEE
ncbi:unnamed protein product [Strongylus vulgaris]|uniref:Uncharacterized protein n=1 Tax=Strongylus vulgaris TaxID=40348 RepID=A0A3P7JDM9_STRVU|nr:unnamed protein product [Strongylus vulgaris]